MSLSVLGTLQWAALWVGAVAALCALYGRYRTLPALLTGPAVCRLEDGGCQVLFRTRQAALIGPPNAALGLILYLVVAIGLVAGWPAIWLAAGASLGLAMSIYLAQYLIRNHLECRICWLGHVANLTLWGGCVTAALMEGA